MQVALQWNSPGLTPLTLVAELSSFLLTALSAVAPQALELPAPSPTPAALAQARDPKLALLMDVELDVTLRFGERQMPLHDILDLCAGSVVELNQYVQDPVELLVGKKVIARGEVVVVDGSYALRVMEIISPLERIESLKV
jgi:flagellar motor switch protein FliN/FliY